PAGHRARRSAQPRRHPAEHQCHRAARRPEPGAGTAGADQPPGFDPGAAGLGRRQCRRDPWREPRGDQQFRQRRPGPARPDPDRAARADPRPAPDQRPPREQPGALPARPRRSQGVRTQMTSLPAHWPARAARAAALLVLAVAIAGCSLGGKRRDAVTIYAPEAIAVADPSWPTVDWQLAIARPSAPRLLDSPRIGVRPVPGELQVYKGAVWAQTPADMLEASVLR